MNGKMLLGIIHANNDTRAALAAHLGICEGTLSAKMNRYRGVEFKRDEIAAVKERYNLSTDTFMAIFFTD